MLHSSINLITINQSITHIAFLGPQGSYSHTAAIQYINRYHKDQIIEHSCQKFSDILTLVEQHHVKYGILPFENSNSGLIDEVCNLLLDTKLMLVGEITIPIKHCLLVNHHISSLHQIHIIYSHSQPMKQCSKFLQHFPSWKIVLCASSAVAIETVAKLNQSNIAALGSIQGGTFYGLRSILSKNLSNHPINTTRFIILQNININIIDHSIAKKIMLIIFIDQNLNKIYTILKILRFYNIKVLYLKPLILLHEKPKNIIILEIIARLHDQHTQQALKKLRKISCSLKILGCYPNFSNSKLII